MRPLILLILLIFLILLIYPLVFSHSELIPFGYYPEFTGRDFLLYMSAVKGLRKSDASRKTDELIELVGLKDAARKKVRTYSGGMKQRLGITQALLNDPQVFIMDEPRTFRRICQRNSR